ncbi:MAG: hypothetical protein P0Y53_17495 [Candidatus Pseudobacter hemicellulosilyticus]|uniref:Uncharacterized protein n=1 Tax=Candidatus Pseudobacter hemicellulosilyticus TaxID=3121375 RepID=A0AAJ5WPN7_9BACT|nr:MAG: hypothetical protein P0Y53_17495 [Pseudobacter sp.]
MSIKKLIAIAIRNFAKTSSLKLFFPSIFCPSAEPEPVTQTLPGTIA